MDYEHLLPILGISCSEKISPHGKTARTADESLETNTEPKVLILPGSPLPLPTVKPGDCANAKCNAIFDKVIKLLSDLKPTIETDKTPTKNKFIKLCLIIQCLCTYVFDKYEVTDTLIKENKEIRNLNNDMKYNKIVTRTGNDMEKAQCTVKILSMNIDSNNTTGTINNVASMRDSIRKNLIDMFKIPADLMLGTLIFFLQFIIFILNFMILLNISGQNVERSTKITNHSIFIIAVSAVASLILIQSAIRPFGANLEIIIITTFRPNINVGGNHWTLPIVPA